MIEDWASRTAVTHAATVHLPANARVPLGVEYDQSTNTASVELRWLPPCDYAAQWRAVYMPPGKWHDFWTAATLPRDRGKRLCQLSLPKGLL